MEHTLQLPSNLQDRDTKYVRARKYVYELLHTAEIETRLEKWTRIAIAVCITLSMISVVLESEPELELEYASYFYAFEAFTVAFFSLEYCLRVWSCVEIKRFSEHPVWGRMRYVLTPLAMVDLLSVLPFFFSQLISMDLRFIRGLRLIRLIRVLKLGHYSTSLTLISKIVR